jgi:chromosome segregation ATPase
MLEFLEIWNAQKHKHYRIEFDPSITTIIGPTGSGKSTLLRMLEFVSLNRQPRKGTWQRDKNKDCIAKLGVDGQIVTREKGKSNNTYYLNDSEFKAFGTGVPEPIAKLLNASEINFQRQLSQPYWFLDTAGQVSRYLNSIINLDIIDSTLANAAQAVKSTKNKLTESQRRLDDLKQKKQALQWTVKADTQLKQVEQLNDNIQEIAKKRARIVDLLSTVQNTEQTKQKATQAVLALANPIAIGQKVIDLADKLTRLKKLVFDTEQLSSIKRPPDTNELDKLKESWHVIEGRKKILSSLITQIETLENEQWSLKQKLIEVKKMIPATCPLCAQPFPNQTHK